MSAPMINTVLFVPDPDLIILVLLSLFSVLIFDFFVFELPTLFGTHRALRLVVEG